MTLPASGASTAVVDQLNEWILAQEGEHFEFKEAKNRFHFEDLAKYCTALANEGGGKVILGVTDKRPRRVVGTQAFPQPEATRRSLMERIPLRIQVIEIAHGDGRVLLFDIPSRPVGVPIKYDGIYLWSREADSLVHRFINSATQIPPDLPLAKGGEPLFGKEGQGRFENTLP